MKTSVTTAAALLLMSGQALGQTVDGQIDQTEAGLYQLNWVQNQPTSFGDNLSQVGEAEDNSDAVNVTTGIELRIPLSNFALGEAIPTGQIRVAGYVNNSDNNFLSNQVLGGLGGPGPNLGDPANVNFKEPSPANPTGVPGNQFIIVPAGVVTGTIPVDGTAEVGLYGAPIFVSDTGTGFGDNTDPDPLLTDGGSELSNAYATLADEDSDGTADTLYLMLGGNLEQNFNKLHLWFDVDADAASPTGQNVIRDDNVDVSFDAINTASGLEFDDGFTADFFLTYNFGQTGTDTAGDPIFEAFADLATTPTSGGGTGEFLGGADPSLLTSTVPAGGLGEGIQVSIDNSNVGGVGPTGFTPDIPSRDVAVGSELNAIYSYISGNRLNVLLAGNLESTGNRLVLFFDGDATDGQNTLRNDNVDVAFRLLDRLGENDLSDPNDVGPEGVGLTFDAGFTADYFIVIDNNGNTSSTNTFFANAATLRLNGPNILQGFVTDFGAYDGGLKSAAGNDPLLFDGDLDLGDNPNEPGTGDDIFTNFGPRDAAAAYLDNGGLLGFETPGLIEIALDNSNIGGVTATDAASPSVADACNVTTGVEVSIDLDELGWDGTSTIKIAAAIANGDAGFWSNQVAGGLPTADQLGEPRDIDFSTIAGSQFVLTTDMGSCGSSRLCADVNENGVVEPGDFTAWVAAFNSGDLRADANQNGANEPGDFTAWVAAFNQGAAGPTCTP